MDEILQEILYIIQKTTDIKELHDLLYSYHKNDIARVFEHLTDEELEKVLKTDVKFVVNSDAHSPQRVGEISLVEDMVKRLNFPTDRIMNIDGRLPQMRFKSFKEGAR